MRGRRKSLLKKMGWDRTSPVTWCLPDLTDIKSDELTRQTSLRHDELTKKVKRVDASDKVDALRDILPDGSSKVAGILAWLQIAYSLDELARRLDVCEFQNACQDLVESATQHRTYTPSEVWMQQWVGVELPLIIAVQMECDANHAIAQLESSIEELVDGDGWIEATHTAAFYPVLACWARSVKLIGLLGKSVGDSSRLKLEWMARQWVRMMGPHHTQMLGASDQEPCCEEMQDAVLNLSSDRLDRQLAKVRLGTGKSKSKTKSKSTMDVRMHDKCSYSEWAGLGVFQCGWERKSPRIAIAATQTELRLELANHATLLRGCWDAQIQLDGRPVPVDPAKHEVNCYHSDEDVEFVEFEYDLGGGSLLQRQVLLARNDQFLLLADVIVPHQSCRIDYTGSLPLSEEIQPLCEEENREVYLRNSKFLSLVLPLGLGEWKSDRGAGELNVDNHRLTLRQAIDGQALYAPLFFDLSPRRCSEPRTWRHLTVAENLQILARDQAVGYRVHVGTQQWLIYRSLSGVASRTFMGENQICEFYVGRTNGDDAAEEILQIV